MSNERPVSPSLKLRASQPAEVPDGPAAGGGRIEDQNHNLYWNRPSALLPINRQRRTPARRSRSNEIGELVCAVNDLAVFSVFSPFYYAKSTSKHAYN
jgi:hypothetical protein